MDTRGPQGNQVVADDFMAALPPQVIALAKILQKAAGVTRDGKPRMSLEQAILSVVFSLGTGKVPGRDFYITDAGAVDGYRGLLRELQADYVTYDFRPMTADEQKFHDVGHEDTSVVCELKLERGGRTVTVLGYGIVRKAERDARAQRGERTMYLSWGRIAQNRALKDAIRHAPVPIPHDSAGGIAVHNLLVREAEAVRRMLTDTEPEEDPEAVLARNARVRKAYPDLLVRGAPALPAAKGEDVAATDEDDDDGPLTDEDVRVVREVPKAKPVPKPKPAPKTAPQPKSAVGSASVSATQSVEVPSEREQGGSATALATAPLGGSTTYTSNVRDILVSELHGDAVVTSTSVAHSAATSSAVAPAADITLLGMAELDRETASELRQRFAQARGPRRTVNRVADTIAYLDGLLQRRGVDPDVVTMALWNEPLPALDAVRLSQFISFLFLEKEDQLVVNEEVMAFLRQIAPLPTKTEAQA